MATKLERPVTRAIRYVWRPDGGLARDLIVTMSLAGITLRGKGTKRKLYLTWNEVAAAAPPHPHMPARYLHDKLGWLLEP